MSEPLRMPAPHTEETSQSTSRFAVTRRSSITRLLQLLERRKVLLNVQWPGERQLYATALLGIYPEHGFIVLDELNPRVGHDKLLERGELTAVGRLDGVSIKLTTRLQEMRIKDGVAFYKFAFPQQIYYVQRRDSHRVSLVGQPTRFEGRWERGNDAAAVTGTVGDLSAEGVGLLLDGELPLRQGDVLSLCRIRLPQDGGVNFDLEVRHATYLPARQLTRVGARLLNIDVFSRHRIEAAIARMERDLAKRKRPD
jgi:c-di-GMP-binding flagellar brake protein YcgR